MLFELKNQIKLNNSNTTTLIAKIYYNFNLQNLKTMINVNV